jgi:hypothetical protein
MYAYMHIIRMILSIELIQRNSCFFFLPSTTFVATIRKSVFWCSYLYQILLRRGIEEFSSALELKKRTVWMWELLDLLLLKSTDFLLGPVSYVKTGEALHPCLNFVSVFVLIPFLCSHFAISFVPERIFLWKGAWNYNTNNIFMTKWWNIPPATMETCRTQHNNLYWRGCTLEWNNFLIGTTFLPSNNDSDNIIFRAPLITLGLFKRAYALSPAPKLFCIIKTL